MTKPTPAAPRGETALLVIDMQNAFLDPQGEHYYPQSRIVVPAVEVLIAAARQGGRLIVHTADRHRIGLNDFEQPKLPPHCLDADWNARFFEGFGPAPGRPAEIVMPKRRYSAFFGTDLALVLHEQRVSRVVVAGIKTNVCVRATIQDAFAHGFEPILVREATNSNRPHLEQGSLEDIERYFGRVISLSEGEAELR